MIGGSANRVDILDNVIECRARMADGAAAIFRTIPTGENAHTRITGNVLTGSADGLGIVFTGEPVPASAIRIADNRNLPVNVENTILSES